MNGVVNAAASKVSADQLVMKESFADEFVCKLCLNVVDCCPQLTKCSHLFCGDCLQEWFSDPLNGQAKTRGIPGSVAPCPVCQTLLRKEVDVYPVEKAGKATPAFLWRMIQGLQIKCNARDGCCDWKGEYGSYLEHLHCGKCCARVPKTLDSKETDLCSIDLHESVKDRSPSPSTCSEVLSIPTLEELTTEDSLDGNSVDDTSDGENVSASDSSRYQDPEGQSLTSLIQELIKVTPANNTKAPMAIESPASMATMDSVAEPGTSTPNLTHGSHVKQRHAKDVAKSKATSKCLTPEQMLAYQWQMAASYQMTYAQHYHYHMAVQTMRMQQYYQQVRMSSGGSM